MNYFCCTDTRRNAVKLHPTLNGIDYLEVLDDASDPYHERQTTLFLHFINPMAPGSLDASNIKIEGGERIRNISVVSVAEEWEDSYPSSPPHGEGKVLVIKVDAAGDFSTYTLCLVRDSRHPEAPEGFDPVLSKVDFSFKVACPSDFDCKPAPACPPEPAALPQINYLAKDYASFRQLMLDRMALLAPAWRERNPADIGITLVELLAYTADYLSYRQDAVATEAYLGTARRRISVRRHARLADYFMHDGCNARAWLRIRTGEEANGLVLEKGEGKNSTRVLTKVKGLPPAIRLDAVEYERALLQGAKVFELMHDITLYARHNEMHFYTWGGKACCLPKGATRATLSGSFPNLKAGDVLIFAEVLGPETGVEHDANPARRHAVRLAKVTPSYDILYGEMPASPPVGSPPDIPFLPVTEIEWHNQDALPFPLCISSDKGGENISVAWGNIALIDHGLTIEDEKESSLRPSVVPNATLEYARHPDSGRDPCDPPAAETIPPRFNPELLQRPLTQAAPFDPQEEPRTAAALMQWPVRQALPAITLFETGEEGNIKGNQEWHPQRDLLNSGPNAREFVVEIESNGTAFIRFGDNKQGARPAPETHFIARYRIGNGPGGNVGANTLAHIATNDAGFIAHMLEEGAAVSNPLPARGGTEPESMEEARQYAPEAFRTQERAVTASDYEEMSRRCKPDIQRAASTFRWTGSWKTAFLTVDRLEGREVDAAFEEELRACLERYRMAGFDLEVDSPLFVSLDIEMIICVKRNFLASDVKQALLKTFSKRALPGGRRGLFHPDNFTFGQTVYLSRLYAAAQATPGVDSVQVTRFQRQGTPDSQPLEDGKLLLGRREIACCDNDPNFPERGLLNFVMTGGR